MTRRSSPPSAGFTIIETLIVLAIGSVILILVFEAITTFTRASRNDQRKHDVAVILQAVSHYELTDSGIYPHNCGTTSTDLCKDPAVGVPFATSNDYFLQFSSPISKLSYYDPTAANRIVLISNSAQANPSNYNNLDEVAVYNYAKCDPNNPGNAMSAGADYRDIVALYTIETRTGTLGQCQAL